MPEERYIFDKARGVATSVVGIPTEFAGHSAVRYKPRYSAVMFVILGLFFVSGLLWTWNNLMGVSHFLIVF